MHPQFAGALTLTGFDHRQQTQADAVFCPGIEEKFAGYKKRSGTAEMEKGRRPLHILRVQEDESKREIGSGQQSDG